MEGENLANDLYEDAKNAKILRRFEEVSIEGDRIILRVRQDAVKNDPSVAPPLQPDPPREVREPSPEPVSGDPSVENDPSGESEPTDESEPTRETEPTGETDTEQ